MQAGMRVKVKKETTVYPDGRGPVSHYAGMTGIVAGTPPAEGYEVRVLIGGVSMSFMEAELVLIGWDTESE